MKLKRTVPLALLCIALIGGGIFLWKKYFSATRVAFLNYQVIQLGEISRANTNSFVKIDDIGPDDISHIDDYDMVFVNGMGLRLTAEQHDALEVAGLCGQPILTTASTNPDNHIVSVDDTTADTLINYLSGASRANYRSMLNYVRTHIDHKIVSCGHIDPPTDRKTYLLTHPDLDNPDGEELGFGSIADYENYLRSHKLLSGNPTQIVVTGQMGSAADIALALEKRGFTPYVIGSFASFVRTPRVDSIRPVAVINMAHGRLGDHVVRYLTQRNIPLFSPLNVNRLDSDWEADKLGMSGGFMSQSIVTPEIDGAIRPQTVFAHRVNSEGLQEVYAIPQRLDDFVESVSMHVALARKPNAEKRIAIYYFKSPGQSALTASGLEVVPSLYNLLLRLQSEGYKVNNLPASADELQRLLMKQGAVLGTYAHGAFDDFLRTGNPLVVNRADYEKWVSQTLRPSAYDEVISKHGRFPGSYMAVDEDNIAVARLDFGNVVLLPQNMAGTGDNAFKIVHGTGDAPPHPFIASYLWMRHGFHADAVIHFGTHGGLEYTPQKQVALSDADWSDRMIGPLPHFYLYTIGNVGESLIAKRRSYATIISHLTPPFLGSNTRGQYQTLADYIDSYNKQQPDSKEAQRLAVSIHDLVCNLGIATELSIDTVDKSAPCSEDDILRIEQFAEELANEKMTGQLYTLGVPYEADRVRSSVVAMTVDPIAYSLLALDKQLGRAKYDTEKHQRLFTQKYLEPANKIVAQLYSEGKTPSDEFICKTAKISVDDLTSARQITNDLRPRDMMEIMSEMGRKMSSAKPDTSAAMPARPMPKADEQRPDSVALKKMKEMAAGMDPKRALQMAKMMGAPPEALKKMAASMGLNNSTPKGGGGTDGISGMMKMMASMRKDYSSAEREKARAISEIEHALANVVAYKKALCESPESELSSVVNALRGGYVQPTPGGDIICNPNTIPTGRNMYGINAENTPSVAAWEKGCALAQQTLDLYRRAHHDSLPRKVSYTLWSGEFIETEGATIAQVLYMLGVEPIRDAFGRVTDIRLIPTATLARPRIDVVVQTSGQLRDLAASRLFLINRAVQMAADADDGQTPNYVAQGVADGEQLLASRGLSPQKAKQMATYRIFGGQDGNYGTGITNMVQAGDRWESESEIAKVYLNNMGAFYGSEDMWQADVSQAFEAALVGTDAVVQPRQSNTWGALSLDHVYEFMGGMNLAVRTVTGKEPEAYLSDYRNRNHNRMQEVREAIGVESRTTILNPEYIKEKMKGGASSASTFAEVVENAYGWEVMKPNAIADHTWNDIYDVYVRDSYHLDTRNFFENNSPAALQQMTAVMMETIRKGYWNASAEQRQNIAQLHTQLVKKHGAACTGMVCDNAKLRDFIADNAPAEATDYKATINQAREASASSDAKVMKKQSLTDAPDAHQTIVSGLVAVGIVLVAIVSLAVLVRSRRKRQ